MWLLIDDLRNGNFDVIARTPEAAKDLLCYVPTWECVCFDHDLGDNVENGYRVMCWALDRGFLPEHVQLVTSNPVGRKNMGAALEAAGYISRDGGTNWRRE